MNTGVARTYEFSCKVQIDDAEGQYLYIHLSLWKILLVLHNLSACIRPFCDSPNTYRLWTSSVICFPFARTTCPSAAEFAQLSGQTAWATL